MATGFSDVFWRQKSIGLVTSASTYSNDSVVDFWEFVNVYVDLS